MHHEQARRVAHGRVPPDRGRAQAVDGYVRQLAEALHHLTVDAAPQVNGTSAVKVSSQWSLVRVRAQGHWVRVMGQGQGLIMTLASGRSRSAHGGRAATSCPTMIRPQMDALSAVMVLDAKGNDDSELSVEETPCLWPNSSIRSLLSPLSPGAFF